VVSSMDISWHIATCLLYNRILLVEGVKEKRRIKVSEH